MSRFNEVKVGEKDGFIIFYDTRDKKFRLRDPEGNDIASEDTQEKVEGRIPQLLKDRFKLPILALRECYGKYERGRITSVNLESNTAWFSYDDKQRKSTEKIYLRTEHGAYELTLANEAIVSQVEQLQGKQRELEAEIDKLEQQFEKPITREYFSEGQSDKTSI